MMDGTIHIGELKARGATMSDVNVKVEAKNGIIRVDPFSMSLYGGGLSGKVTVNVQEDTPKIKTIQHLEKVQVGPLLNDLGYTDRLEGLANFKADISVKGTEPEKIKKTLSGSGEFTFTDGAIIGFDIARMARNLGAALGLSEKEKPRTEFSEVKGNFTVKNGLLDNPRTYLSSPLLRVEGKGKVNLPKEAIDYRVEPKLVGTLKGQGDTKGRRGLMVPIVISGTFSDPKFRLDISGISQAEAERFVEGLKEGGGDVRTEALEVLKSLTEGEEGEEGSLDELLPGLLPKKKKR